MINSKNVHFHWGGALYSLDLLIEFLCCDRNPPHPLPSRESTRLALDQTHEQCNAVVKGKRGVTDLFLKNEALRRWSIVQPIVVDLLKDFHQKDGFSEDKFDWLHHEESC